MPVIQGATGGLVTRTSTACIYLQRSQCTVEIENDFRQIPWISLNLILQRIQQLCRKVAGQLVRDTHKVQGSLGSTFLCNRNNTEPRFLMLSKCYKIGVSVVFFLPLRPFRRLRFANKLGKNHLNCDFVQLIFIRQLIVRFTAKKAIPNAYNCLDCMSAVSHFHSQSPNMHVNRTNITVVSVAPNVVDQKLASSNPPCACHKSTQYAVLLAGQGDTPAVTVHAHVVVINSEPSVVIRRCVTLFSSSKYGSDTCH